MFTSPVTSSKNVYLEMRAWVPSVLSTNILEISLVLQIGA
jgi:hypothetical protein